MKGEQIDLLIYKEIYKNSSYLYKPNTNCLFLNFLFNNTIVIIFLPVPFKSFTNYVI